jgi:hypothetical protein
MYTGETSLSIISMGEGVGEDRAKGGGAKGRRGRGQRRNTGVVLEILKYFHPELIS